MPDKPAGERTEQPTRRRLQKAKEKGRVAVSQELPSAATIIAMVMVMAVTGSTLMHWFVAQIKQGLSGNSAVFTDTKVFIGFVNTKIISSIAATTPIYLALCVGSVLACVAVSGLNFAPAAIKLRFEAIDPVRGFKRLFSGRSLVRLIISIAKLLFVSLIVWVYLNSKLETLASLRWAWSAQIIAVIAKIIMGVMIRVCLALIVIAAADVFYQKHRHRQDLKMTKHELKQERKDTEGMPEVKARIRRIQITMARKRMLQEVPKADVVLVNPTHVAVALRYDVQTMEAPILLAKGADELAEKIRQIATAYGIPVIRRPELARTIYSTVKLDGLIPQELYVAIAEVLALIYRLRHRK